jgi:hypothetical protein
VAAFSSLAGDVRPWAAVGHVVSAREGGDQHVPGCGADQFEVRGEDAAFGDCRGNGLAIEGAHVGAALDGNVLAGECQYQQPEQRAVLNPAFPQRLVERVGAEIPDHRETFLGHVRPGLGLRGGRVRRWSERILVGLRRFPGIREAIDDSLYRTRIGVEVMADPVIFARRAVDVFGFLRQLRPPVFVLRQHRPALGEVILQPLLLRAEETVHIGRVAAVLVGGREEIVFPDHAVGLRQIIAEFCRRERNAPLGERAGDLIPAGVMSFLGLVLLPDLRLLAAAMVRI